MKIIGYGICGPGEANRYMRKTLEEFQRLCDETIILCNNAGPAEKALIYEFGFRMVQDNREWGVLQWRIKQDFLEAHVAKIASEGDMLVCLDMDEVLDQHLTPEWIRAAELDAYHVFIVNLWNEGHKARADFWNVRMWRWNGDTKFHEKALHCGLAPQWAYHYHRFAPFILLHYGLKERKDRDKKIARYEKYDPKAKFKDRSWYELLKSDTCDVLDVEKLHDTIAKEVGTYKQTKPRRRMSTQPKTGRFAYVTNPAGNMVDIPEHQLKETLARGGFTFLGWADDAQEEIGKMFDDTTEEPARTGIASIQRPMADERKEIEELKARDDAEFDQIDGTSEEPTISEQVPSTTVQSQTKVVTKKAVKKIAKKVVKKKAK